jgi:drug/metabolite transporter (DMT)-like permease
MRKHPLFLAWIYLILLAVVWGTSFILIKRGLVAYTPNQVAALRIVISGIALSPVLLFAMKRIPKDRWLPIFGVGLFGSGIPPFLYSLAQTVVDSMVAGILNSVTSLFTLIIGVLLFRARPVPIKVIGVFVGLAGAAYLIYMQSGRHTLQSTYSLYIIVATICYGTSVNLLKRYCQDVDSLSLTTLAFMMIAPPAAGYLFTTDFLTVMQDHEAGMSSLMYISILAVFGTAGASALFFKLVQMTSPLFGATVTFLIPIVAVMWGWIDGEAIGTGIIVGMILILAGVWLTNRPENRQS